MLCSDSKFARAEAESYLTDSHREELLSEDFADSFRRVEVSRTIVFRTEHRLNDRSSIAIIVPNQVSVEISDTDSVCSPSGNFSLTL